MREKIEEFLTGKSGEITVDFIMETFSIPDENRQDLIKILKHEGVEGWEFKIGRRGKPSRIQKGFSISNSGVKPIKPSTVAVQETPREGAWEPLRKVPKPVEKLWMPLEVEGEAKKIQKAIEAIAYARECIEEIKSSESQVRYALNHFQRQLQKIEADARGVARGINKELLTKVP